MNKGVRWLHRVGFALRQAQEWLSRGLQGLSEPRTPRPKGNRLRTNFEGRRSPSSNHDTQADEESE